MSHIGVHFLLKYNGLKEGGCIGQVGLTIGVVTIQGQVFQIYVPEL